MIHCLGSLCMAIKPLCASTILETPRLTARSVSNAIQVRRRVIDAFILAPIYIAYLMPRRITSDDKGAHREYRATSIADALAIQPLSVFRIEDRFDSRNVS